MKDLNSILKQIKIVSNVHLENYEGKNILWGLAPTGAMHLGYLPALLLLKALQKRLPKLRIKTLLFRIG